MELSTAIETRRSIRSFNNKKIEDEKIEKILESAMVAPSARNAQPWEFIVVDKQELLEKMADIITYGQMLREASHGIIVCFDTSKAVAFEYGVIDTSAATQNILLRAHDLGLGAVWLGVYPREERVERLKDLFSLPENIIPVSGIALGYSEKLGKSVDRFDPKKIHKNGF